VEERKRNRGGRMCEQRVGGRAGRRASFRWGQRTLLSEAGFQSRVDVVLSGRYVIAIQVSSCWPIARIPTVKSSR